MLFNFLGAYDNGYTYSVNDAVQFNGSTYVMDNYVGAAGYDPLAYPGNWELVVSKGDTGAPGPAGADGPAAAPMSSMGTWSSGVAYTTSNIVVHNGVVYLVNYSHTSSTSPDQDTYNYTPLPALTGPQGPPGPQGIQGIEGPGDNARKQSIADSVRFHVDDSLTGIDNQTNWFHIHLHPHCLFRAAGGIGTNVQLNPYTKWFGVYDANRENIVPAYSITTTSNQNVVMQFNLGYTVTPGQNYGGQSPLFYTEDGGTTWYASTFWIN